MSQKKKDQTNPSLNDQDSNDSSTQSQEQSNYSQKNQQQKFQMRIYDNAQIQKTSNDHKTKESKSEQLKQSEANQIQKELNKIFNHLKKSDEFESNYEMQGVLTQKQFLSVQNSAKGQHVVQNYIVLHGQDGQLVGEMHFQPWDINQQRNNQFEDQLSSNEEPYNRNPHDDSSALTSQDSSMVYQENTFQQSYNNQQ